MTRLFATSLLALSVAPFHAAILPLAGPARAEVKRAAWHPGCPVPLSDLRLLTVSYRGFDRHTHTGRLVVNRAAAARLALVFRQLYALHFPIRHMSFANAYGPARSRPADGDVSAGFECRQAVPSPCVGGRGTGTWSEHAFGEGGRPEPRRESLRRLWSEPRPPEPALLQPLGAAAWDGDPCGRSRLPLDRMGLGRQLERLDQGLHALLGVGTLAARAGSGAAGVPFAC